MERSRLQLKSKHWAICVPCSLRWPGVGLLSHCCIPMCTNTHTDTYTEAHTFIEQCFFDTTVVLFFPGSPHNVFSSRMSTDRNGHLQQYWVSAKAHVPHFHQDPFRNIIFGPARLLYFRGAPLTMFCHHHSLMSLYTQRKGFYLRH